MAEGQERDKWKGSTLVGWRQLRVVVFVKKEHALMLEEQGNSFRDGASLY